MADWRSQQFGSNKPRALMRGKAPLHYALDTLRRVTPYVLICSRAWSGSLSLVDRPAANMKPLDGLSTTLHHRRVRVYTQILSLACDKLDILSLMVAQRKRAYIDVRPVIVLWPSIFADALEVFYSRPGTFSLRGSAELAGANPMALDGGVANFDFAGAQLANCFVCLGGQTP